MKTSLSSGDAFDGVLDTWGRKKIELLFYLIILLRSLNGTRMDEDCIISDKTRSKFFFLAVVAIGDVQIALDKLEIRKFQNSFNNISIVFL